MTNRRRKNQILFYVDDEELRSIESRMISTGFRNRSAYLRKVAIDAYIIHIENC